MDNTLTLAQVKDKLRTMMPEQTPELTFKKALSRGQAVFLDDPRFELWHTDVKAHLYAANIQDAISRIAADDRFTPRESMRYPSLHHTANMSNGAAKAIIVGMLARTASYLRANVSFADQSQYDEAYLALHRDYGDFSLADFAMVFEGIRLGTYVKINYRFLLPELRQACDYHNEHVKVDQRERREKTVKHYREDETSAWMGCKVIVNTEREGREARRLPDRVKWMHGKDVMDWSQKAQLQERDRQRRNEQINAQ